MNGNALFYALLNDWHSEKNKNKKYMNGVRTVSAAHHKRRRETNTKKHAETTIADHIAATGSPTLRG